MRTKTTVYVAKGHVHTIQHTITKQIGIGNITGVWKLESQETLQNLLLNESGDLQNAAAS